MNSMRPETQGFQKPLDDGKHKVVRLGVVKVSDHGVARCSCGWGYVHPRAKVRDTAIDKHFLRRHSGRGIRL